MGFHSTTPAFAVAEDPVPAWRMARSPDGVEDAIHHDGRFYSVTYTGRVEAWQCDDETGEFTSQVVAPPLAAAAHDEKKQLRRKYLAASTDGRLMAVLKHTEVVEEKGEYSYMNKWITRVHFEVQVLDQANGRWEAADMGGAALFVGVNGTVCVSAREHRGIAAGIIYFTDDEVGDACLRQAHGANYQYRGARDDTELQETGVYCLKLGKVIKRIPDPEDGVHPCWPPPAWFTPSFL